MKFLSTLKQPYPLFTFPEAMKRDIFFGVFLTLFLLVFTPFGLRDFAYDRFYIIAGYGVVSYLTIATNDIIAYKFLLSQFNEANWKVYKQILLGLWHLFWLGVFNLVFGVLVDAFPLTALSFFKIEVYVLASSIIPVMGITILRQNYLLKQNLRQAANLNDDIQQQKSVPVTDRVPEGTVRFMAENERDFFETTPSSILCISSQDNYVEFVFEKDNKICKQLLRSTLSRVEESLLEYPDFFRCHRAYVVNLKRIESVEGNSQGYRIKVEGFAETIPVARPKKGPLKDRVGTLNKAHLTS